MHDEHTSQPYKWINIYREMYTNCTIVKSNLEILHLKPVNGSDHDLSFFENIREVHGYVLVALNLVSRVPLTSLRVIRGRRRRLDRYSLFVAKNADSSVGLRYLEMPSLIGELQRVILPLTA